MSTPLPQAKTGSLKWVEFGVSSDPKVIKERPSDELYIIPDDWLVLEGYVNTWVCHAGGDLSKFPQYRPIKKHLTCALTLNDLNLGIQWLLSKNPNGGLNARSEDSKEMGVLHHKAPPEGGNISQHNVRRAIYHYQMNRILGQLVSYTYPCDDLKILVGEVPKNAKPGDFEELAPPIEDADGPLSTNDKSAINAVQMELNDWMSLHKEWVNEWVQKVLDSDKDLQGIQIRNFSNYAQMFSRWLNTPRGHLWLGTDPGSKWLDTKEAHEWLIWSNAGIGFLQSDAGIKWLNTEKASKFLNSDYSVQWGQEEGGCIRRWIMRTEKGQTWWYKRQVKDLPKPELQEPAWISRPEKQPMKYEFHTKFESDPRSERISDLFINIPKISFVRYRGGC
ncbi:hypothetical protein GGR51DRAFT_506311 [Nemania sp. FL0031]|nr:hypothetical protein GGR51DRAFT_506311 [Nemania sp. FL0031]